MKRGEGDGIRLSGAYMYIYAAGIFGEEDRVGLIRAIFFTRLPL